MTPDELRAAGVELHGAQWQTPLARDLLCSPRAVRAWLKGTRAIPGPAVVAVRLLIERRQTLDAVRSVFGHGYLAGGHVSSQDYVSKTAIERLREAEKRMSTPAQP